MQDGVHTQRLQPWAISVFYGIGLGLIVTPMAVVVAIWSGGMGHGDYIAARILFPAPMLLTLVEGGIGTLSMIATVSQFPLYGGLLGWAFARGTYLPPAVLASEHLVAALFCFGGALSGFVN